MTNVTRKSTMVLFTLLLVAGKGCGGSKSTTMDGASGTDAAWDTDFVSSTGGSSMTGGALGSGGAGGVGSGAVDGSLLDLGGGPLDATATGGAGAGADAAAPDGADPIGNGSGGAGGVAPGSGGSAAGGSGGQSNSGGSGGVPIDGGAVGGHGGSVSTGGAQGESCPQTAPKHSSACSTNGSCYYEDCADKGRTEARCSSGLWFVSTAACRPVKCVGFDGSVSLNCPVGQVCVAPFGEAPICASHTCGSGPIRRDCVPDAKGTCNVTSSSSLANGITLACCMSDGTSC